MCYSLSVERIEMFRGGEIDTTNVFFLFLSIRIFYLNGTLKGQLWTQDPISALENQFVQQHNTGPLLLQAGSQNTTCRAKKQSNSTTNQAAFD